VCTIAIAIAVAVAVVVPTLAAPAGPAGASSAGRPVAAERPRPAIGPGAVTVRLHVRNSRFRPARLRVAAHTEVRFEVVNHDIINHELIVGDETVHARHEAGTEAAHPPVPGEVSVPPHTAAVTSYQFHEPGVVLFACHLPGHFAYGMKGTVRVVADATGASSR